MKHSQKQHGQASPSDPKVKTDAELSDNVLDTITGSGNGSAIPMQNDSNAASTNTDTKSINDLVGRVVNKNFA